MSLENLFVYGELKDPETRKKVLGRNHIEAIADFLENYRIMERAINIEKKYYPNIVPALDGIVEGLVIKLTDEELRLLDEYETQAYKRIKAKSRYGLDVWVYVKS